MGSAASKTARRGPPRTYPKRAAGAMPAQGVRRPPVDARRREDGDGGASQRPATPATPATRTVTSADAGDGAGAGTGTGTSAETSAETSADLEAGQNDEFARRLRRMGMVEPHPTFSPSSRAGRPTTDVGGPDADMLRQIRQHEARFGAAAQRGGGGRRPPPVNATLAVLEARRRLQDQAAAEAEAHEDGGRRVRREFLSAATLRQVLELRAGGVAAADIEQRLSLRAGVVARLGPRGLVEPLDDGGSGSDTPKPKSTPTTTTTTTAAQTDARTPTA